MLRRLLVSLKAATVPVVVIDNSFGQELRTFAGLVPMTPPAPMTLWQTMWMLCRLESPFLWSQCDAIVQPTAVQRLLSKVEELEASGQPWGAIFTHYDILSAVNATALLRSGVLPDLNIPHYHGDIDWYRRMRLAGLPTVNIGGDDVSQSSGGGGHWRDRPDRDLARQCMDSARYYREKWGGEPHHETYETPWNKTH